MTKGKLVISLNKKMEMTGVEPVSKHIAISISTFVSQLFELH